MNHRSKDNKKQSKTPTRNNLEGQNRIEGQDKTNRGSKGRKESTKSQETEEQATNETIDSPSNKKEQESGAIPMDGKTRDDNTPMQEAEGDANMTSSEVGT